MPPHNGLTETVDLTRLNRQERRKRMHMGFMMPGRNMPFQKKLHGTVAQFNAKREEELKEEAHARSQQQVKNAAAISSAAGFSTTAIPDKPLEDKATG